MGKFSRYKLHKEHFSAEGFVWLKSPPKYWFVYMDGINLCVEKVNCSGLIQFYCLYLPFMTIAFWRERTFILKMLFLVAYSYWWKVLLYSRQLYKLGGLIKLPSIHLLIDGIKYVCSGLLTLPWIRTVVILGMCISCWHRHGVRLFWILEGFYSNSSLGEIWSSSCLRMENS